MMNFYNDRLAPAKLCRLLYEVVPEKFHRSVIFSYGRGHMPKEHKSSTGCANDRYVWLNLESIAFYARGCAARRARVWREMLRVGFHEFGHIASGHCAAGFPVEERYKHDGRFHQHIEDQANVKADEWMKTVLANDSRLCQPDFLGVVDIIASRNRARFRSEPINWRELKDYRCHLTGGQLSIGDVVNSLFRESYRLRRNRVYRLIRQVGDDLARVHVDSAGRHHHFWVFGDLQIIAERLSGIDMKDFWLTKEEPKVEALAEPSCEPDFDIPF